MQSILYYQISNTLLKKGKLSLDTKDFIAFLKQHPEMQMQLKHEHT